MVNTILPLIPIHRIYTESFFGGGAVFFAKEPSESEIINDSNAMVINFFRVAKGDFKALKEKVEQTLFARATYSVAWSIYRMPHLFSPLQQAWAFYVGTNMGFATGIGSWGYDRYGKRLKSFLNKKMTFDKRIAKRLEKAQIECGDAIKVIKAYDIKDSFHYIDPPYIDTNQGHYKGYCLEQYKELLETLTKIEGKFLLSGFPNELLDNYITKHKWSTLSFDKPKSASKASLGEKRKTRKTEVLVANYSLKVRVNK